MLSNKNVLVTRPQNQSEYIVDLFQAKGAAVDYISTIEIKPVDDYTLVDRAISVLDTYDWIIFTSANSAFYFLQRLQYLAIPISKSKIAAVGRKTAEKIEKFGYKVNIVPDKFVSDQILQELGDVSTQKILLPQGNIARQELKESLINAGAVVDNVIVYNTNNKEIDKKDITEIIDNKYNYIIFMSPSAVRSFCESIGEKVRHLNSTIVCIGPTTTNEARGFDFKSIITSKEHTSDGILSEVLLNEKHLV